MPVPSGSFPDTLRLAASTSCLRTKARASCAVLFSVFIADTAMKPMLPLPHVTAPATSSTSFYTIAQQQQQQAIKAKLIGSRLDDQTRVNKLLMVWHSPTHPLTHPLTHSLAHSFAYLLFNSILGAIVDPVENVRKVVRRITTYDCVEKGIKEYDYSLTGIRSLPRSIFIQ